MESCDVMDNKSIIFYRICDINSKPRKRFHQDKEYLKTHDVEIEFATPPVNLAYFTDELLKGTLHPYKKDVSGAKLFSTCMGDFKN